MADKTVAKQRTKGTSRTAASRSQGFSAEERAAMEEAVRERKRAGSGKADGESDVRAKIAEMQPDDRLLAERIHAVVKDSAPDLVPRTWYGMPAYANQDGKIVCHFQPSQKFKTRYSAVGFSDSARLDEGSMWPVGFAVKEWTPEVEGRISALLQRAVG